MVNTRSLITSDWHLTDSPQDSYRHGIFEWLIQQVTYYKIDVVCILGDLTDKKDNHSAKLTNNIVSKINTLSSYCKVRLLRGNHDCLDANHPFFRFLNKLNNVEFIVNPQREKLNGEKVLYLPHSRNPTKDWANITEDKNNADYIFLHQTFSGARASNGSIMTGISTSVFDNVKAMVISGDIHVPQTIGNIIYVGSPYQIRFGDGYDPRILIIQNKKVLTQLQYPTLKKHHVKVSRADSLRRNKDLRRGDQIKVTLTLPRSSFVDWEKKRRQVIEVCDELGLELNGRVYLKNTTRKQLGDTLQLNNQLDVKSPVDVFDSWCVRENTPQKVKDYGRKFL